MDADPPKPVSPVIPPPESPPPHGRLPCSPRLARLLRRLPRLGQRRNSLARLPTASPRLAQPLSLRGRSALCMADLGRRVAAWRALATAIRLTSRWRAGEAVHARKLCDRFCGRASTASGGARAVFSMPQLATIGRLPRSACSLSRQNSRVAADDVTKTCACAPGQNAAPWPFGAIAAPIGKWSTGAGMVRDQSSRSCYLRRWHATAHTDIPFLHDLARCRAALFCAVLPVGSVVAWRCIP
jgi:hypothetical protein